MHQRASAFASAVTMTGGMWRQDGIVRFAHQVRCALQGLRPYEEMLTATAQETLPEGQYEQAARMALAADVNPFPQLARAMRTADEYWRLNVAFMRAAPLPFRTYVDMRGRTQRVRVGQHDYPDIKGNHELTVHLLSAAQDWLPRRPGVAPAGMLSLQQLGRYLNVDRGILGDVLDCMTTHPALKPAQLATALGLVPHQLARLLRPIGVRASELRELAMLQAATRLMLTPATLTEIAHDVGYADGAHLSRAFARATGVAPSMVRPQPQAAGVEGAP
jgi:AraC-like DNA-binding protein